MRPGQLCPGRDDQRLVARQIAPGFNEAGAVMPRKGRLRSGSTPTWNGFNEAGAVMPRKGGKPASKPYGRAGFNEAGAVMPRKAPEFMARLEEIRALQ